MERKLLQFYIIKTSTNRLKRAGYSISFNTVNQIRERGELVSLGESQLIRSLFKVLGKDSSLNSVRDEMAILSPSKRARVRNIEKIDNLLFIPEIVSLTVDSKKDYREIIKNGFFVNGKKYVRLLCGAGHSRRNNVVFIQEDCELPLKKILNNDRNLETQIAPSKFNAYFALCSSATYDVSAPYFSVVKDAEIVRDNCKVEIVDESHADGNPYLDDLVYETEMSLQFNLFDGQGLISPRQAKVWAEELGLNYIPSTFIVRNSFLKGMVVVFDFHKFAEIHGKKAFLDVWGNAVDVRDVDIILTESQLKIWQAYSSHADYVDKCRKNNLTWGISRYSPEVDRDYVYTNYQFLQVEDFTNKEVESLCKKTVDFFGDVLGEDPIVSKLYMMGRIAKEPVGGAAEVMSTLVEPMAKALLLEPKFVKDPHIRQHIYSTLFKRTRESYIGNLLLDGNYQTIISDPYALCEHIFGMEVKGLLKLNKHYSEYWNRKNVKKVAAMRAPLTWSSELNILNLVQNKDVINWYGYIHTGIVYNIHGYDCMLQADSDFDGDIIMTTNQPEIIKNAKGGLPITYSKNKTPKETIQEETLFEYDLKAFDSRIGFITNCSTTLYAMLPQYRPGSIEHEKILKRLKICRKEQGNQIDKAKGLVVKPFPTFWTKWTRITDKNFAHEKEIELNNRVLVDKRPYFMRHLYSNYNRDYKKHLKAYNSYCGTTYGVEMKDLPFGDKRFEEVLQKYEKFAPLIDGESTMNKICHYMENKVEYVYDKSAPDEIDEDLVMLMKDNSIPFDSEKYKKMEELFTSYRSGRNKLSSDLYENRREIKDAVKFRRIVDDFHKIYHLKALEISDDVYELTNYAVSICYELHPKGGKAFAWSAFGEFIVDNIAKNLLKQGKKKYLVPIISSEGVEYMGQKYSEVEVAINPDDYI